MAEETLMREHLALAERHVADGERLVNKQIGLIAELAKDGHDVGEATRLLEQLETAQMEHVAHRARLIKELELSSKPPRVDGQT